MKKFLRMLLILGLVSLVAAQETPKHVQKIYKVVFLLYEVEDGKKINERTYTVPVTTVDNNPRDSSITVGTRVPVATETLTGDKTVFQYLDVGLRIECNVAEQDNKFIVHGDVELSSIVSGQGSDQRSSMQPIVRRIRQTFTTLVPPGKPTVVTTADDINSKKSMQMEVTATRIE